MKNKVRLLIILCTLGLACQPTKETGKSIPSQLESFFATMPDFSGVVLIADRGKPVYHRAFGYFNFETKIPLDTSAIFELASVSKQFTSAAIMMLEEGGKLKYDDPLEKYIPGLPYKGITLRHLLNHTSGLPDYQQAMEENWDKSKVAGNEDIIQYLKQYQPARLFEPGEKYEYSNTGFVLLGTVAEKASGKDFIEFCSERIFTPVGMTSTGIRTIEEKVDLRGFARGHIYVPEKKRYVLADSIPSSDWVFWLGHRKGPGRVSSTAGDLLRWDRALYGETLLKKESLEQAFTQVKLKDDSISNYGFGWSLRSHPDLGRVVYHTGTNPGYKTIIIRYLDADKTAILLSNNAYSKLEDFTALIDKLVAY